MLSRILAGSRIICVLQSVPIKIRHVYVNMRSCNIIQAVSRPKLGCLDGLNHVTNYYPSVLAVDLLINCVFDSVMWISPAFKAIYSFYSVFISKVAYGKKWDVLWAWCTFMMVCIPKFMYPKLFTRYLHFITIIVDYDGYGHC